MFRPMLRRLASPAAFCLAATALSACSSSETTTGLDRAGAFRADIVLDRSDPRAEKVVESVTEAAGELKLAGVVFGAWVGDHELVRGAIDAEPGPPPTSRDAAFRVGQPMESMLTTILLQLAEEGKIGLDEPIAKYLPELPRGDRITPRMLANSTAGISDYVTNPEFGKAVSANPFAPWTYSDLMAYALDRPPLFPPGTSWAYSHSDFAVLGRVLEVASRQSIAELMRERIFEPLGLDRSTVVTSGQIDPPVFHAYTSERGPYEESTFWNPTWALSTGNMNSTVADIGRWARALASGELLSPKAHEEQFSTANVGLGQMTAERYFTFGTIVQGDWIAANPQLQGYHGLMAHLADPSVTLVVYVTPGPDNDQRRNDAIVIGRRLAALLAPGHPLALQP
jgi:D-alanyl-D-alanine carboxypeptidase